MQTWILEILQSYGALGIFLLIFIETIFPPIPSELILSFGGFLITVTSLSFPLVLFSSTLASLLGALLLYGLGRCLSFEKLLILIERYGHILHLKIDDVKKAMDWYEKYEEKTVFFCRMLPIVRSLISIPAGMSKMRISSFIVLTTLGSLIWNSVLITCGHLMGEHWESVLGWVKSYSYIALGVILLGMISYIIYRKKS